MVFQWLGVGVLDFLLFLFFHTKVKGLARISILQICKPDNIGLKHLEIKDIYNKNKMMFTFCPYL